MKKIAMRFLLITVLIAGMQLYANAQIDPPDNDPDAVPLDPGSWVLVAAGVGYGVKKWRDAKQEAKKNSFPETPSFGQNNETDKN